MYTYIFSYIFIGIANNDICISICYYLTRWGWISFNYEIYKGIEINLKGVNQNRNALLAIETMEILKGLNIDIDEKAIREGLKTVIHQGRFEVINKEPLMIYDGAHNEDALDNFINTVDKYYSKRKRVYVLLILKRKNYKKMLKKIFCPF